MPVLINFKICDNSDECDGIKSCPVNAFKWNDDKKTIYIDESTCIGCGLCAESCSVGAIKFAKDAEECDRISREIEEDSRTVNDLFVDRYGAAPIQNDYLYEESKFNNIYSNSSRPIVIELFSGDTIRCLLKSIPINEILEIYDKKAIFRKVEITGENILNEYNITELPALIFFKNGEVVGKIEGYYEDENSKELFSKIKEMTI